MSENIDKLIKLWERKLKKKAEKAEFFSKSAKHNEEAGRLTVAKELKTKEIMSTR